MDNIALIGHSRGGEAAATAAMFNKMKNYPDCANISFNFNYGIKSVIAIAPSFGQYQAADRFTRLDNVDYFTIQGANDHDVSMFMGRNQYERVYFNDDSYHFKSSLYVYNANHGQFNTEWGRRDLPGMVSWFLNLKPLMEAEDQQKIAKVYFTAFLESTLKGKSEYIDIFKDSKLAEKWLPRSVYINRFEDSNFKVISNYEEDTDPATATIKGGKEEGNYMKMWSEKAQRFRKNFILVNNILYLEWDSRLAKYDISVPYDTPVRKFINKDSVLSFAAADADNDKSTGGCDFTVRLTDVSGESAEIPVSKYCVIAPPISVKLSKWDIQGKGFYGSQYEPQLQTIRISMKDFIDNNEKFNPDDFTEIEFVFNKKESGKLMLDDIGIEGK
jgi:hypothetical protein